MTIAICAVVPEGIVLGADSVVSSSPGHGQFHFFRHNQKLFEVGENGTMGIVTWGLASFGDVSFRTLIAKLADELAETPPETGEQAATMWRDIIWETYQRIFENEIERCISLDVKLGYGNEPSQSRTKEEEEELKLIKENLIVGFCIAGHLKTDRSSFAFEILIEPDLRTKPPIKMVPRLGFWGAPDFILRIFNGFDRIVARSVLESGLWKGTEEHLETVLSAGSSAVPLSMPLRDAADFVHFCIYATIQGLKFSNMNQICGGPIEIAVISTDRNFRWIEHKDWDSSILDC
jgi:hypothetical protein